MSDEQDTPNEEELEAQRRASAQQAAADLDLMGIDPKALGLEAPPPREPARPSAQSEPGQPRPGTGPPLPPAPPQQPYVPAQQVFDPGTSASVTPLRPEYASAAPPMAPGPPGIGLPAPAPPPLPPAPQAPRTPAEELLARTAGDLPAPSRTGGLLKQVTFGMVTPDSADAAAHERELVAALRTRQTERRVVSFFAGKGGVGTTTVVAGVGTAFAALREENTVAVDVRSGTASLGQLMGVEYPITIRRFLSDGDEARVGVSPTGLHILDGVGWEQSLRRTDISTSVERLGADHTFTLLDVGNDASDVGHAAVARSDQTVIVTAAGRTGFAALEVAIARLGHTDPFAVERAIFVVVCQHDEAYRLVHREAVRMLAVDPMRVVVIPPDPVLVTGRGFDPSSVRVSTRTAMLKIGAALALSGGRQ